MRIRKSIQIIMLGLIVSTALDGLFIELGYNIEIKMDVEKDSESSEKDNLEKKDAKHLKSLTKFQFINSLDLSSNFKLKNPTFHSYVDEELIPPEL